VQWSKSPTEIVEPWSRPVDPSAPNAGSALPGQPFLHPAGHAGANGDEPAAPWPLKIVLDDVVGSHKLPSWLDDVLKPVLAGSSKMQIAAVAAIMVVAIALVGALASYVANYYTESVGQWVANDLCMRTYHQLERLSLGYFDSHQTGALLSTITSDIQTIQSFASSSTLSIVIDLLTSVGMLGIMFWLNWDLTLIVIAVTPFMLVMRSRFKKVVTKATREVRKQQGNMVAVVQQGLES
jgi:ABC-type multidrug transport system fused ATPase/permease subunit